MSNTTRPIYQQPGPSPHPDTAPYWRHLADCNLRHRTTDNQAERDALLDRVADKCIEMLADYVDGKGPYPSIYHAHALVGGHECHCYNCERDRKLAGNVKGQDH